MFPYDSQLLDAVSTPPASIADVIRTMQTIDSLCIAGDGLKWFNSLYLQVTQSVADRVAVGRPVLLGLRAGRRHTYLSNG